MSWALNQLGPLISCRVHVEAEDSAVLPLFSADQNSGPIANGNGTLRQSDRRLLSCYNSGRVDVLLDFVRLEGSSVVCQVGRHYFFSVATAHSFSSLGLTKTPYVTANLMILWWISLACMPERCKTPLAAANFANLKQNISNIFVANQKPKKNKTNFSTWVKQCVASMWRADEPAFWRSLGLFFLYRFDFPHYLRQIFKMLAAF